MSASVEIPATAPTAPRLRIRADLAVEPLGRAAVLFASERGSWIVRGEVQAAVVPLLDGERDEDAVVDALEEAFEPAEVYYALGRLRERGLVVDAGSPPPSATAPSVGAEAVHGAHGHGPAHDPGRLVSFGPVDVAAWSGVVAAALEADPRLTVVLTDHYLRPGLEVWNRRALDEGRTWLPVRVGGTLAWVGPVFVPGRTACFECLSFRLRRNRPIDAYLAIRRGATEPLLPLVGGAATRRVLRALLADGAAGLRAGCLVVVDAGTGERSEHPVHRRDQCPACGDPTLYAQRVGVPPLTEAPARVRSRVGGYRTLAHSDTLQAFEGLVDPLTGVVDRLDRLAVDGAEWMNVYMAGRNLATGSPDAVALRTGLRRRSSGKGRTDEQARASALGESIERYCGELQGDEPSRTASLRELGDDAIHPNACMLFSRDQQAAASARPAPVMDDGLRRSADGAGEPPVPPFLPPDEPIQWTPVWSLGEECRRWLPTALLYYSRSVRGARYCFADSNGCAAGNTLEEAVLQGLLELIERDAASIWWYNRVVRPRLSESALRGLGCLDAVARYRTLDRDAWLLDLTNDVGVPVLAAVSRARHGPERVLLGLGAHVDPAIAAERALSEMDQMLAAAQVLDADPDASTELSTWLREASLADHPYLAPGPSPVPRSADGMLTPPSEDDVAHATARCRRALAALGLDVLLLDQTRPDVGVPVVRMIVPGLRGLRPRFAPGRLYDVPVRLGWLSRPRRESQFNPVPFFL